MLVRRLFVPFQGFYLATGHEETLFSALLAVSCLTHKQQRRKYMFRHQVALNWKKYQKLTIVILLSSVPGVPQGALAIEDRPL